MVHDNIGQFNEVTATIFAYLYDQFPKPAPMEMHKLVDGKIDEYEMTTCPKTAFARDVVNWLVKEEFIRANGGNFAKYSQCVLTAKGLDALSSTPTSLGGSETVISKLKSGLASGSREALKAAIGASVKSIIA